MRTSTIAAGLVLGAAFTITTSPASAIAAPMPGAPGIGDRIFPALGNGGYDVGNYDLSFNYDPATARFVAHTEITARATGSLSRFNLDLGGNRVLRVRVDGARAAFRRAHDELIVTPPAPLRAGRTFVTQVDYKGTPTPHEGPAEGELKGWFPTPDGFFLAPQPDAAHTVLPSNDHPSDKATMTYRLTVPNGLTAVAGGTLVRRVRDGKLTTWIYRQQHPVATELVQIVVGRYSILRSRGPHGLELRDVVPTRMAHAPTLLERLAKTPDHLAWLERRLGRYPFEAYGTLGGNADILFAQETQTLSVINAGWLRDGIPPEYGIPEWYLDSVFVHELAHQWFGNSVSPRRWADAWLNEGPTTYYQMAYAAGHGGPGFPATARAWYAGDQELRDAFGAPAAPKAAATLYEDSIYGGGALVLFALRQKVGRATFDRIMRTWLLEQRDASASTRDFVGIATRVSGRDLSAFLRSWLRGPTTPPMPGHPDWTSGG